MPRDKSVATLDLNRYEAPLRGKIRELLRGEFLAGATNVCLIGRPGTGKSHVMAALARALVEAGHPVLFTPVVQLVERLLEAKKNLRLARELKRLDNFDCIALDDIGYVQHDRAEMEVLFALLAERYERKSVMITSNLVFSKWDQIFKDPMTTAAAIDRVVHHAVVLEFLGPSATLGSRRSTRPRGGVQTQPRATGGRMILMRPTTQTRDTEVAASSRTPLLDDLRRSINGAMFRKTRKRSF